MLVILTFFSLSKNLALKPTTLGCGLCLTITTITSTKIIERTATNILVNAFIPKR